MTTPADQPDLSAWLRNALDQREAEARLLCELAGVANTGTWLHTLLAEVDAKRRILDLHAGAHECSTITYQQGVPEVDYFSYVLDSEYCTTVLLLALPHADRPGYQERWRP